MAQGRTLGTGCIFIEDVECFSQPGSLSGFFIFMVEGRACRLRCDGGTCQTPRNNSANLYFRVWVRVTGAEISKRRLCGRREAPLRKGRKVTLDPAPGGWCPEWKRSLFVSAISGGLLPVHLCPPSLLPAIRRDGSPSHRVPWGALPLVAAQERAVVAWSAGVSHLCPATPPPMSLEGQDPHLYSEASHRAGAGVTMVLPPGANISIPESQHKPVMGDGWGPGGG